MGVFCDSLQMELPSIASPRPQVGIMDPFLVAQARLAIET
jgi:hypothetical protein